MKKHIFYLAIGTLISISISCKKKEVKVEDAYTCTTCTIKPEAIATNDNSSKGIYKGIVIGSTGTIKFDISNTNNTISATLVLDGVSATLTSAITWTANQAYLGNFTGTYKGDPITINFSVGSTGQSPTVTTSNIPGHTNAVFSISKEASNNLIECFEGSYSTTKPETGTFNLVLSRTLKAYTGTNRPNGTMINNKFSGNLSNDQLLDENGKFMATLTADKIYGQFKDNSGNTVTINAKRTL